MPSPRKTRTQKPRVARLRNQIGSGHGNSSAVAVREKAPEDAAVAGANGPSDSAEETEPAGTSVPAGQPSRRTTRVLSAWTAVLCVLAACFGIGAHLAAPPNRAMVDETASTEVSNQVREIVEKTFTYDYRRPAATEDVAKQRLDGPASQQYQQLSDQIRHLAPQQNIVLTTKVQSVGVMSLDDGHARLLVFADKKAEQLGTGQRNAGPAQLEIAARRHGETWNITGIAIF